MYIVESKYIRECLEFRIKSLDALDHGDIADFIREDLQKIMQHENYINKEDRK